MPEEEKGTSTIIGISGPVSILQHEYF
jgi:hypothetical protein